MTVQRRGQRQQRRRHFLLLLLLGGVFLQLARDTHSLVNIGYPVVAKSCISSSGSPRVVVLLSSTANTPFSESDSDSDSTHGGNDGNLDDDEEENDDDAIVALRRCAKITFFSSGIDLGTFYGRTMQGSCCSDTTVLTIIVRSFWKALFAWNIYRLSRFRQRFRDQQQQEQEQTNKQH